MEELKITGIVLKSVNYGEKDKIITIFSLELGKVVATLKGVNSSNAKLKFASQVFCFAEFVLAKKSNGYVVTSVNLIDSFYDLTLDYDNFLIACALIELVELSLVDGETYENLFVLLLKSLKEITYNNTNTKLVITKFMLSLLKYMGYEIQFENCQRCNLPIMNKIYFDVISGDMLCENCKTYTSYEISKQEFAILRIINATKMENLKSIKSSNEVLLNLIKLLKLNLQERFNKKIKSLNFED